MAICNGEITGNHPMNMLEAFRAAERLKNNSYMTTGSNDPQRLADLSTLAAFAMEQFFFITPTVPVEASPLQKRKDDLWYAVNLLGKTGAMWYRRSKDRPQKPDDVFMTHGDFNTIYATGVFSA